jgi:hypothetical protein
LLTDWLCIAWLVVHCANLLLMHAKECLSINTGAFLNPRVSKALEFTGGLKNAARIVGKGTKSTTPINP